jgi:hypothetical protein
MTADTFGQRFTNLTNTDKYASVITQQQEDGMNQKEYNALLHAIWRLDSVINSQKGLIHEDDMKVLKRDREALGHLFARL